MALTDPLGMQIYSGRKFPPIEAQFETIARSGFTNIETFGPLYDDVEATKRMLDTHGLTAKSGHFSVAMAESESERVVEIAKRLGVEVVVAPYLMPAERPATLEGWKKMGTRLLAIGERSRPPDCVSPGTITILNSCRCLTVRCRSSMSLEIACYGKPISPG